MIKFKPLHDRLLVKRIEQESKTPSGIIIPDSAQEKPMQGEVVAVGNGTRDEHGNIRPLEVKVGDIVLFAKWGGTEIKLGNVEHLVMKESDVLGIVTK